MDLPSLVGRPKPKHLQLPKKSATGAWGDVDDDEEALTPMLGSLALPRSVSAPIFLLSTHLAALDKKREQQKSLSPTKARLPKLPQYDLTSPQASRSLRVQFDDDSDSVSPTKRLQGLAISGANFRSTTGKPRPLTAGETTARELDHFMNVVAPKNARMIKESIFFEYPVARRYHEKKLYRQRITVERKERQAKKDEEEERALRRAARKASPKAPPAGDTSEPT
mmetsp:Transcript_34761/g.73970  ORF Transcript_34761/g.73970 Transcript_34761/m.73970 type:complete len:224 (+) Transcript_34761:343-1014(+)